MALGINTDQHSPRRLHDGANILSLLLKHRLQ